jgi:hypothetical protein
MNRQAFRSHPLTVNELSKFDVVNSKKDTFLSILK